MMPVRYCGSDKFPEAESYCLYQSCLSGSKEKCHLQGSTKLKDPWTRPPDMKYKVPWGKRSSQNSPLITPHRIMPHCHLHSTSMSAQVSTRVFPKPAATSTALISLSAALHSYRDPVPLVSCHSKATDTRFWIFYIIDSIENIVEKSSLTVNTNTQKNFRRVTIENKMHVCMQRGLGAASLSEVNSMGTQG